MVVSEQYPNLRANQGFRDLSAQLEGTENRITAARNRYIKTVQDYNVTVRSFPSNLTAMVMGYKEKPTFAVEPLHRTSELLSMGMSPAAISAEVGIPRATVYRIKGDPAKAVTLLEAWGIA